MNIVRKAFLVLTSLCLALNVYIYQYDKINGCKWPIPSGEIKFLAFGDPQIPGSTENASLRKKVDVWGNDHYLSHIFSVMAGHFNPSHVAVMGDLISSQWVRTEEFYRRANRYSKIFRNDLLSKDSEFFNISGNHDIGYAGEMSTDKVDRYESVFGDLNYVRQFDYNGNPWRVVTINSLSLDSNTENNTYHENTLHFLHDLSKKPFNGPTILLIHVPLYKEAGVCSDGPYFQYYFNSQIQEQNHLSQESTQLIMNSVYKKNKQGIILTGHDHEGCRSVYEYSSNQWTAVTESNSSDSIQEVTVRSMMGEYGGNTGMVSGLFDPETNKWTFEFDLCPFAVQHLWWVTKVLTVIDLAFAGYLVVSSRSWGSHS